MLVCCSLRLLFEARRAREPPAPWMRPSVRGWREATRSGWRRRRGTLREVLREATRKWSSISYRQGLATVWHGRLYEEWLTNHRFRQITGSQMGDRFTNHSFAKHKEVAVHIAYCQGSTVWHGRLYGAGSQITGLQITGSQITGLQITGSQITGSQITGLQITGSQIPGVYGEELWGHAKTPLLAV